MRSTAVSPGTTATSAHGKLPISRPPPGRNPSEIPAPVRVPTDAYADNWTDYGIVSPDPDRDVSTLYRILIHDLSDFAVFMMDSNGIITTWNAGVERNLGYTEEEFVGHPVSMIFVPEDI